MTRIREEEDLCIYDNNNTNNSNNNTGTIDNQIAFREHIPLPTRLTSTKSNLGLIDPDAMQSIEW